MLRCHAPAPCHPHSLACCLRCRPAPVADANSRGAFLSNINFYPGRHGGVGHYDRPFAWSWATTYWNNGRVKHLG